MFVSVFEEISKSGMDFAFVGGINLTPSKRQDSVIKTNKISMNSSMLKEKFLEHCDCNFFASPALFSYCESASTMLSIAMAINADTIKKAVFNDQNIRVQ